MMPSHMNTPNENAAWPAVEATHWLAVGALVALIVLGLAWELWLAPVRPGGTWLAVKVLPLCLPLGGLLAGRLYTFRWTSMLVWLYFIEGAVRATSDAGPSVPYAVAEVVLCLLLFTACVANIRLRTRKASP